MFLSNRVNAAVFYDLSLLNLIFPSKKNLEIGLPLVADRALMNPDAPRSGLVEVTLRDGRTVNHFTRHPPGTKENPLDTPGVNEKARSLMAPVLGPARARQLIAAVHTIERLASCAALRPLLRA